MMKLKKKQCTICNEDITSIKSNIDKHLKSEKHLKNAFLKDCANNANLEEKLNNIYYKTARAEIVTSRLFASRHIAFLFADYYQPILKKIINDSLIVESMYVFFFFFFFAYEQGGRM